MDAEFGRKIGNGHAAQDARVRFGPSMTLVAQILSQTAKLVVDAAVQHHFGCAVGQPLRCKLVQQRHRVVIQLAPANRVQVAKEAVDLYKDSNLWQSYQSHGTNVLKRRFGISLFSRHFIKLVQETKTRLQAHRADNFTGMMLQYHSMNTTKYMSKYIQEKNKTKH